MAIVLPAGIIVRRTGHNNRSSASERSVCLRSICCHTALAITSVVLSSLGGCVIQAYLKQRGFAALPMTNGLYKSVPVTPSRVPSIVYRLDTVVL